MSNPCHKKELPRLRRARGQVDGIIRMVESGRYCVDILTQLRAVRKALQRIEQDVMQTHMHHCLEQAVTAGERDEISAKIDELSTVLRRFAE